MWSRIRALLMLPLYVISFTPSIRALLILPLCHLATLLLAPSFLSIEHSWSCHFVILPLFYLLHPYYLFKQFLVLHRVLWVFHVLDWAILAISEYHLQFTVYVQAHLLSLHLSSTRTDVTTEQFLLRDCGSQIKIHSPQWTVDAVPTLIFLKIHMHRTTSILYTFHVYILRFKYHAWLAKHVQ